MPETKIAIELSTEDAFLFAEFRKRYQILAPLVGYMEAINVHDLKNMSIQMDIDKNGIVSHTAFTRHFRP